MARKTGIQMPIGGRLSPLVGGETARKMAIPAATVSAPRMSGLVSLRAVSRAIMGSANSTSVAASGCTRVSGPKTSATPG